uniref:Uncharacterized protein n=1 Tax=Timema poppense TaxID=170557 RepID=A0A7R9GYZ8_TIMPO|nr:unnamed protein product [Timema poppensis]
MQGARERECVELTCARPPVSILTAACFISGTRHTCTHMLPASRPQSRGQRDRVDNGGTIYELTNERFQSRQKKKIPTLGHLLQPGDGARFVVTLNKEGGLSCMLIKVPCLLTQQFVTTTFVAGGFNNHLRSERPDGSHQQQECRDDGSPPPPPPPGYLHLRSPVYTLKDGGYGSGGGSLGDHLSPLGGDLQQQQQQGYQPPQYEGESEYHSLEPTGAHPHHGQYLESSPEFYSPPAAHLQQHHPHHYVKNYSRGGQTVKSMAASRLCIDTEAGCHLRLFTPSAISYQYPVGNRFISSPRSLGVFGTSSESNDRFLCTRLGFEPDHSVTRLTPYPACPSMRLACGIVADISRFRWCFLCGHTPSNSTNNSECDLHHIRDLAGPLPLIASCLRAQQEVPYLVNTTWVWICKFNKYKSVGGYLCGLGVLAPDSSVPGLTPGASRFSVKQPVWNGVNSVSSGQIRSNLNEKVAAPA